MDRKCYRNWSLTLVCLVLSNLVGAFAKSQDTYTPEQLHRYFQSEAESYSILREGANQPLQLKSKSLMHWQNTERRQEQGSMYAWMDGQRPIVFGSIFTYTYAGTVFCKHELLSISDKPLNATVHQKSVWTPRKPGIEWHEMQDAPEPGESPARRLTQIRALSREFSGVLKRPDGQVNKLQLIPQPLIRYQAPDVSVIDGAVFSLAVVTDPEILLVVEAFDVKGQKRWRYGVARSHYWEVSLLRNNVEVWNAPLKLSLESTQAGQRPEADDTYFTFAAPTDLPPPDALK